MNRGFLRRWAALGVATAVTARLVFRTRFGHGRLLSRGTLIRAGASAVGAIVAGDWGLRSFALASPEDQLSSAPRCVLTPEQTEGPYFIPREKFRSNISEHKPGIPLRLRLAVVDASTCKPIKGAAVDIWHCDGGGVYSGFGGASTSGPPTGNPGPTDKRTFLRGIQATDSKGRCQFQTIYPGWYRGRTVHIHVKVHLGRNDAARVIHTGQLYFSDSLTARVYRSRPYKARASARDTFNSNDGIYQNGGRQSTLSMRRDGGGGYEGTITLGVRRS